MREYRAVFGSKHNDDLSYGPVRLNLRTALQDKPERSEETHEYIIGAEAREVQPWRSVPLSEIRVIP